MYLQNYKVFQKFGHSAKDVVSGRLVVERLVWERIETVSPSVVEVLAAEHHMAEEVENYIVEDQEAGVLLLVVQEVERHQMVDREVVLVLLEELNSLTNYIKTS